MVRGIDATLFVFAPEDVGAQTEVEDWVLEKAKSFGGDRSAAGRYAAEQRWKGHVKAEPKGKRKPKADIAANVTRIVTRLAELDRRIEELGLEVEQQATKGLIHPSRTTEPLILPSALIDASEEVQRLGAELLALADQKMVADGVVSQRELDAAKAEFAAQEAAVKLSRQTMHAIMSGETTVVVEVNGKSYKYEVSARLAALVYDYRRAHGGYEQLVRNLDSTDRDKVPSHSDLRSAREKTEKAAFHLKNEYNAWWFNTGHKDAKHEGTTEAARMVQQARFKAFQELLGMQHFGMTVVGAELGRHLDVRYSPDLGLGTNPPERGAMRTFVDSTLSLFPRQAISTLNDTEVLISGERYGDYFFDHNVNRVTVGQDILSPQTAVRLGPDTRSALGHELTHAVSFADTTTRAVEQGALAAVRNRRPKDGWFGLMPVGTTLEAVHAAAVWDDLTDAYSGRVYQFGYLKPDVFGRLTNGRSSYSATEMLTTGFEYLVGGGRIQKGYDGYVAGLTAGWMAMMVARSGGA